MSEKKPKHPGGRPTLYTPELAERICEIIESHPHGIRRLTKMFPELPDETTIAVWRAKHEQFSMRYMEARKKQTHLLFECAIDEVEELADYTYYDPKSGATRIDAGIVAMKKVIASQKVRHAAQINPKEYDTRRGEENNSPTETLSKIQALVADLNKDNKSEI